MLNGSPPLAYHQPYTSDAERQAAFPDWLDWYNYHRPHTGIGGQPPANRVTNVSGQHTQGVLGNVMLGDRAACCQA